MGSVGHHNNWYSDSSLLYIYFKTKTIINEWWKFMRTTISWIWLIHLTNKQNTPASLKGQAKKMNFIKILLWKTHWNKSLVKSTQTLSKPLTTHKNPQYNPTKHHNLNKTCAKSQILVTKLYQKSTKALMQQVINLVCTCPPTLLPSKQNIHPQHL